MRSFMPDQQDGDAPQMTAASDAQPGRLPTK